jgi:hypothetical protein
MRHPLAAMGIVTILGGAVSEVTGIIPVLAVFAVLAVAGIGFLIRELARDRGRTYRPGDDQQDEPASLDDFLSRPVRTTAHVMERTPDDGYEATR